MRYSHFESLQPVCPRCLQTSNEIFKLVISKTEKEQDDYLSEGILCCSNPYCCQEYPVIDGIPIIVPNVREYLQNNLFYLLQREDLSPAVNSLLGDACTQDSLFNLNRQYLSTYTWDSYAEFLSDNSQQGAKPGAVKRCLDAGLQLFPTVNSQQPLLDLGCAVGRSSFELAEKYNQLVLGVDINFAMLRLARNILESNIVTYPQRRVGLVYDTKQIQLSYANRHLVDFWACDATALPFSGGKFSLAVALNLLDSITSPAALLESMACVLCDKGQALLSTPYDWSAQVTPVEGWIGGHSQRAQHGGASEPLLRSLFQGQQHTSAYSSLHIIGEINDFPWHTRIHSRSTNHYSVHILALQAS